MKILEPMLIKTVRHTMVGAYGNEGVTVDLNLAFNEAIGIHMISFYGHEPTPILITKTLMSALVAEPGFTYADVDDVADDPDCIGIVSQHSLLINTVLGINIDETKMVWLPEIYVITLNPTYCFRYPSIGDVGVMRLYYKRVQLTDSDLVQLVAKRR